MGEMTTCMACGAVLKNTDYPRKKTVIFGVQVDRPVVCWDIQACLRRVEKDHPTLVPDLRGLRRS